MIPTDRRYLETHEWALEQDGLVVIGITAFAIEHLAELAFLSLPEVGTTLDKGERFGEIESTKAVSELFTPVAGEVVEINEDLVDEVDQLSSDAYDGGWMIKIKPSEAVDLSDLKDAEAYQKQIDEE